MTAELTMEEQAMLAARGDAGTVPAMRVLVRTAEPLEARTLISNARRRLPDPDARTFNS